jgi:hypothetical protein
LNTAPDSEANVCPFSVATLGLIPMVKHGIHVVPRDYIFTHDTQCRNAEYHNTMFSNAQLGNAVILCCVSFDECNHVKRCFTDCTVYFLSAILMNVIALQLITTIFFYKNAQIKK